MKHQCVDIVQYLSDFSRVWCEEDQFCVCEEFNQQQTGHVLILDKEYSTKNDSGVM